MGRFLQHVLPKGFVKVRYYGLFSRRQQLLLAQIRQQFMVSTRGASTTPPQRLRYQLPPRHGSYGVRYVISRCGRLCCSPCAAVARQLYHTVGKQATSRVGTQSRECGPGMV